MRKLTLFERMAAFASLAVCVALGHAQTFTATPALPAFATHQRVRVTDSHSLDLATYYTVDSRYRIQSAAPTESLLRYGALYDTSSKSFLAIAGAKAYEIEVDSPKILNPEVWAVGGVNLGPGRSMLGLVLAEAWKPLGKRLTIYFNLGAAAPSGKKIQLLPGASIQFSVLKF